MSHDSTRVQDYLNALTNSPRDDLRVTASGAVVGRFMQCDVKSIFQPIVAAADWSTTAVQALVRASSEGGAPLSPADLFRMAADDDALVTLDRRCRIVHTLNFFRADPPQIDLLLGVNERLLTAVSAEHGRAFRGVLESLRIPTRRVVIQMPPLEAEQTDLHAQVIGSYRVNGFRVAAVPDDPAALRRLLAAITVDVVRVDAQAIAQPGWSAALDAARDRGAQIHATRVETFAMQARAREAGATHLQGWLVGSPMGDAGRPTPPAS